MLSSSITTPFSVRDILHHSNEQQQMSMMDYCDQTSSSHHQAIQHQDYYSSNYNNGICASDNSWELDKYKEHQINNYHHHHQTYHHQEMGNNLHHQINQVQPYQNPPVTEDGEFLFCFKINFILFKIILSCYFYREYGDFEQNRA